MNIRTIIPASSSIARTCLALAALLAVACVDEGPEILDGESGSEDGGLVEITDDALDELDAPAAEQQVEGVSSRFEVTLDGAAFERGESMEITVHHSCYTGAGPDAQPAPCGLGSPSTIYKLYLTSNPYGVSGTSLFTPTVEIPWGGSTVLRWDVPEDFTPGDYWVRGNYFVQGSVHVQAGSPRVAVDISPEVCRRYRVVVDADNYGLGGSFGGCPDGGFEETHRYTCDIESQDPNTIDVDLSFPGSCPSGVLSIVHDGTSDPLDQYCTPHCDGRWQEWQHAEVVSVTELLCHEAGGSCSRQTL